MRSALAFNASQIRSRINEIAGDILEQTRRNRDEFVWTSIQSLEELQRVRMDAMDQFLADYETGKSQGRYIDAGLPELPFADHSFDLALCSHFLFLYSDQLGEPFHHAAVLELCRVARDVRIFPLLALGGIRSPLLAGATATLREAGCDVTVEPVPYEFQRGGNEMMRIKAPKATGD